MAPEFSLETTNSEQRSLQEQLKSGPVLVVFFKISCPTCHLTLPLLDRLAGKLTVFGISQDDAESTIEFLEYFRIMFPVLIDPAADRYPTSTAYGITSVPSLFFVERDRSIAWQMSGFLRTEWEERLGVDLFRNTDSLPEIKPGCGSKN